MRTALLLCTLAAPAAAQSFTYPDFASTAGLVLNDAAIQSGNVLRVTSAAISERGSVWYDQRVPVTGGFDTTFEFQITSPAAGGGDGMALLIHDDPDGTAAIGNHASAMGYGAFASSATSVAVGNSLAIELDCYNNGSSWGDPDANHISIHTAGGADNSQHEDFALARETPAIDFSGDGQVHTLRVRYLPPTLEVYLDDLVTPLITTTYDITTGGTLLNGNPVGGLSLTGGMAYVGFTAGNGGAWENHDVLSWSWSYPTIGQNYCSPAVPNSTGNPARILASGSLAAADDDVNLLALDLPPNQFGYFICGQTVGFIPQAGGSQGNLCLGLPTARLLTSLQSSGAGGMMSHQVDTTSIPLPPTLNVAIGAGDTWHWQAWYRDVNPNQTSNFTDGLTIAFQ